MQLFKFTAKDKSGRLQQGEVEAENESSASQVLASKDLTPIEIKPVEKDSIFSSFSNRVSMKDKVLVSRQLATMVKAGLPLTQALKTLENQTQNTHLRNVLEEVSSLVQGGSPLSQSFSKFPELFKRLDIALISSGEQSGNLDKALLRLADQLEKDLSLTRKIRGALIYPAVILIVVVGVVGFIIAYVMPQMKDLYASLDSELPFLTNVLLAISDFVTKYYFFVIIVILGLIFSIRYYFRTTGGRRTWDAIKLNIYGVSNLIRMVYLTRFTRTLSGLVSAGVPILDSLKIVSESVGNVFYEEETMAAQEKVKSGVALSEAIKDSEYFPPLVTQMIAVGEQTGELDNMLNNLAEYFEEEVDTLIKGISTIIEPILIVFLGVIVALILLAIMMPLYSLSSGSFK